MRAAIEPQKKGDSSYREIRFEPRMGLYLHKDSRRAAIGILPTQRFVADRDRDFLYTEIRCGARKGMLSTQRFVGFREIRCAPATGAGRRVWLRRVQCEIELFLSGASFDSLGL